MQLPVRTFDQIVNDQTSALQAANPALSDLTPGSPLFALVEANAGVALWMQYLVYKALTATRLATCSGPDVDSFGADFLFARYPAIPASGSLTMTRFTASTTLTVPVGLLIRTNDGSQTFQVIGDNNNALWDAENNVYSIPVGLLSWLVLVQAVVPGTGGNIAPGTLTKLAGSLAISTVTNAAAFNNGADGETDDAYRSRFRLYINTRDKATTAAIENAIITVNPNVTYTLQENVDAAGNTLYGNIVIVVDDGTGSPPAQLILAIQQAVEEVRPAGSSYSVAPAIPVNVSVEVGTTFSVSNKTALIGPLGLAIANYINSLAVGETLFLTRLYQVMYNAVPTLIDAYDLTLNGLQQDLVIAPNQVARFLAQATPPATMTID